MRLPVSLWKLLSSRRAKLALAWSPFVFAALVAASYAAVNGYGANALRKLATDLEGRGYPRTMAEARGPALPDSENLLVQPAVLAEMQYPDFDPFGTPEDDPFGVPPRGHRLTWLEDMRLPGLLIKSMFPGERHVFISDKDFSGAAGIGKARELLDALRFEESRRRALIDVVMRYKPHGGDYDFNSETSDKLGMLLSAKNFLNEHAALCLAVPERKADALEGFLAALALNGGMQTAGLNLCDVGEGANQFKDTLTAALGNPLPGIWTDGELLTFDKAIREIPIGHQTGPRQRLYITALLERWRRQDSGKEARPQRINWNQWWRAWEPDPDSVKDQFAAVWHAFKPQGLHDLELRDELLEWSREIEAIAVPPDWPKLVEAMDGFSERFQDLEASYFSATFEMDFYMWTEDAEVTGQVWLALARHAIALERHRLRHGRHPAALEEIDADLCDDLPADPFTGSPMKFRAEADGGYSLWSLGFDGIDQRGHEKDDFLWYRRGGSQTR